MIAGIRALFEIMNGQGGVDIKRAQSCPRLSPFRQGEPEDRFVGKRDQIAQYV